MGSCDVVSRLPRELERPLREQSRSLVLALKVSDRGRSARDRTADLNRLTDGQHERAIEPGARLEQPAAKSPKRFERDRKTQKCFERATFERPGERCPEI